MILLNCFIQGFPKETLFFVESEKIEVNVLVAIHVIRGKKSEGSCCRNLLSGGAFLFSSVIALEKKDKCVLYAVSSIGKFKKKEK